MKENIDLLGNIVLAAVGLFYVLWGVFNWRIFKRQRQVSKTARILKSVSGAVLFLPAIFHRTSNNWWHITLWVWALLFIISNAIEEWNKGYA